MGPWLLLVHDNAQPHVVRHKHVGAIQTAEYYSELLQWHFCKMDFDFGAVFELILIKHCGIHSYVTHYLVHISMIFPHWDLMCFLSVPLMFFWALHLFRPEYLWPPDLNTSLPPICQAWFPTQHQWWQRETSSVLLPRYINYRDLLQSSPQPGIIKHRKGFLEYNIDFYFFHFFYKIDNCLI